MNTESVNKQQAITPEGVKFTISRTIKGQEKEFDFVVKEPTLAVLEEITTIQKELDLDALTLSSDSTTDEARLAFLKNKKRVCRIVALAVAREYRAHKIGPWTVYTKNNHQVRRLSRFFSVSVEPSNLLKLVRIVNVMTNLPDFILAVRLMNVAKESNN